MEEMQPSDAGEAPLKMEKDGFIVKLLNNEGIWGLCQDVVSSLSYTQWSVLEREPKDVEFFNLIAAGAKNRSKGGKKMGGRGRRNVGKIQTVG